MPNYLSTLYSGVPYDFHIALWNPNLIEFYPVCDLDRAEERMLELAPTQHIYHSWNVLESRPANGRGKAEDFACSVGIMFDADLLSDDPKVHKQTALPNDVAEVMDWLKEARIDEPQQVRSSGNGLYLDWLFEKPVTFRTGTERQDFSAKVRLFHRMLRTKALEMRGWKFDNTDDLPRVTRMPGTLNHKTNPPKLVELLNV